VTTNPDPLALYEQADRAFQDSRRETETLERVRAEALLGAKAQMSVPDLAGALGLSSAEMRRRLARARRLTQEDDY
jgi:hypothetical protein